MKRCLLSLQVDPNRAKTLRHRKLEPKSVVKNYTPALSFSSTENYSTKEMDRDRNDTDSQTRTPRAGYTVSRIFMSGLPVPVLGLDVVGEGLGLLGDGVAVAVVVVCRYPREHVIPVSNGRMNAKRTSVGVLLRTDVVQLDDVAALVAALDGALARDLGVGSVLFRHLNRAGLHVRSAS